MKGLVAAMAAAPVALTLLFGAGFDAESSDQAEVGINVAALPPLARQMLPALAQDLQATCPELPALWVLAEVQAESSWDPRSFSSAGAAGLLQLLSSTWADAGGAGGTWTVSSPPPAGHPVWDPAQHLAVALPWMCGNLRPVTAHLQQTGKPTEALDALAVCHIAGCSRVFGSATGIPTPGEAGCGSGCVAQITADLATIHRWVQAFAAPVQVPTAGTAPQPYPGGPTGCTIPDPTGTGGCVTGATAWLLQQVALHIHQGPVSCWDRHAWNPTSDHPLGKACDYTFGRLGTFPGPADVARGWQLATWLRAYAAPLHVAYVIWQGRIWSTARDSQGWRPYSGGGIYNVSDPTGGHWDHVHVSLTD